MKTNTTAHTQAAATRSAALPSRAKRNRGDYLRGRQGSAIILVIVSIVLMVILGTTFVQVARFERISTGGEHIDIAINSILNEVAIVLAEDLYADNGDFFNAAGRASLDGGGDEPYDYPWTNATAPGLGRQVVFFNGMNGEAQGGRWDDTWLADASFVGLSNDGRAAPNPPVWGHLSDLTGKILAYSQRDLADPANGFGTNNPGEIPTTAALMSNVPITGADPRVGMLVDCDGDGIGDGFWAYAPAAEIAGKQYVYVIRIIDLSGRVNVNTAIGQTNPNTGNIPSGTTQSAHGDSPTEVDGIKVGFVYGGVSGAGAATGANEFAATIGQRTTILNPNWGDANLQRRHYWLNGASAVIDSLENRADDTTYPSYDTTKVYGEGDLFELLYRHGLNNTGVLSELEVDMPMLLRAGNGIETFWGDAFGSEAAYIADNPRLIFTTVSGEMAISVPVGSTDVPGRFTLQTNTGERVLQADINHSTMTKLTEVIEDTLGANRPFNAVNFPAFFGPFASHNEMASQLAVNIVDMRDTDNRLSSHNNQFGMEALPFIAEVYAQREYGIPAAGTANGTMPETYTINFTAISPSDYAIEIRNPFSRPIDLNGVHLFVNGATWGELAALPTAPTELLPGEVMIIFRNNSAAPENIVGGVAANHFVDMGSTAQQWPVGAGTFSIELRAEPQASAGTALAWAYSRFDVESLPGAYTEAASLTPLPIEPRPFLEISNQGTGAGLNMLQTRPTDVIQTRTEPSGLRGAAGPALGNPNKAFTPTNSWDTGDQQWLFLDKETAPADTDGRIPNVADVLLIPIVGPNDPSAPDTTLADTIGQSTTTRLDGLMLDYHRASTPVVDATTDPLNVPHAILLMRRLTTHNPAVDGFDLDLDGVGNTVGAIDDDEVFVPGKINPNTATYDVLRTALPFPSETMRNDVAQQIIDYREGTGRLAGSRAAPGIAYVGELYEEVLPDVNANIAAVGGYDAWDWNNYQNPRATSSLAYQPDGIGGDREEDLMLAKWLNEVCSTRSDVFAVYMVVQGFPAGNFEAGAVESARVVAVFSRANVRQVGDKAQLIAVRRVE